MVLNTASRLLYSAVMGVVRMLFFGGLVLGAVWMIKIGQGGDTSQTFANGLQWVVDKGKRYVWNAAGDLFNQ